jgi:hypothetical protein
MTEVECNDINQKFTNLVTKCDIFMTEKPAYKAQEQRI